MTKTKDEEKAHIQTQNKLDQTAAARDNESSRLARGKDEHANTKTELGEGDDG
jgi:hypothetical protein